MLFHLAAACRVGRTARAGAKGRALTFIEDDDRQLLKEVRLGRAACCVELSDGAWRQRPATWQQGHAGVPAE